MKKKTWVVSGILVLVIIAVFMLSVTAPPETVERAGINGNVINTGDQNTEFSTVPYNKETSTFQFEGFGPGKSHLGTFDEIEINIKTDEESNIIGLEGKIKPESVNTGIERLDTHLKSEDFFSVEKYPEISFDSTSLVDGMMTGDLIFLGVTKSITFPVEITQEGITTDFVLETTDFGADFGKFANSEVRITFNLK